MKPQTSADYDAAITHRCEQVLVTVLGDIGPWRDSLFLAGGLAPRYLIDRLPDGAKVHVGTTDVDFIITLTVDDSGAYRTLVNNLQRSGFAPGRSSYQWKRAVNDATIIVEFLCETQEVPRGRIHMPRRDQGSRFGALNVEGAELAAQDFVTREIAAERLDDGGISTVSVHDPRAQVATQTSPTDHRADPERGLFV